MYWTVDPIDGTSHFVRGNDLCTTMIALVDCGAPVIAVIHDFVRKETYTAIAGQGAFKNGSERLSVSNRTLPQAYLEAYVDKSQKTGDQLLQAIEHAGAYLLSRAATGRTFIDVARGATEGFISFSNPYGTEWDNAPGALLVHEAGGIVRNVGSDTYRTKDFDMIAANKPVSQALEKILKDL